MVVLNEGVGPEILVSQLDVAERNAVARVTAVLKYIQPGRAQPLEEELTQGVQDRVVVRQAQRDRRRNPRVLLQR